MKKSKARTAVIKQVGVEKSVALCGWLEKHFVTSDVAADIAEKARLTFNQRPRARSKGSKSPNRIQQLAHRSLRIDDWSAVVTCRKAQETFLSSDKKRIQSLADQCLKRAESLA